MKFLVVKILKRPSYRRSASMFIFAYALARLPGYFLNRTLEKNNNWQEETTWLFRSMVAEELNS